MGIIFLKKYACVKTKDFKTDFIFGNTALTKYYNV